MDERSEKRTVPRCSYGLAEANYDCRFCGVRCHRGDSECRCSTTRPQTQLASLCQACATAFDRLHNLNTRDGQIHQALIREATHRYMRSSDD